MLTTPGSDGRLVHLRILLPLEEKNHLMQTIHVSWFYVNLWGCTPLHVLLKTQFPPLEKVTTLPKKKERPPRSGPTFQESMRPVTWLRGVRTNHWMSPIFVWPYYFSSCSMYGTDLQVIWKDWGKHGGRISFDELKCLRHVLCFTKSISL